VGGGFHFRLSRIQTHKREPKARALRVNTR
jgi:hypothetical protein